jgi:hypothetical protein
VTVELTLAGSGVAQAELSTLKAGVETRLTKQLEVLPPGGLARQAQLVSAVLTDPRIVDARVLMSADGGSPQDRLDLGDGVALQLERPMIFAPVETETDDAAAAGPPVDVDLALPVTLLPGVTAAETQEAIRLALQSHLDQLSREGQALTFDGIAAAIRDDTRFALDRAGGSATVETAGQFTQLTDGLGSFAETEGRTLRLRGLDVAVEEGGG